MNYLLRGIWLSAAFAAMGMSTVGISVNALAADDRVIEEIVVSAQRREENLQDVPMAVSAFSSTFIEDNNITDFSEIANWTPGVDASVDDIQATKVNIRGIVTNDFGIGTNPATGVYVDDIYVGRGASASFELLDIERVEVVKGPQGTLFGVNSIGGAVSVTSKKPDEVLSGGITVEVGDYSKRKVAAYANIPLADSKLYSRISVIDNERDGTTENDFPGGIDVDDENDQAARIALRYLPNDNVTVDFVYEHHEADTTSPSETPLNATSDGTFLPPGEENDVFASHQSEASRHALQSRDLDGASLRIDWDLENSIFSSITGYRTYDLSQVIDADGTALFALTAGNPDEGNDTISQEFRLTSASDGDLKWMIGASFFNEDQEQSQGIQSDLGVLDEIGYFQAVLGFTLGLPLNVFLIEEIDYFTNETDSYAVYGDGTYAVSEDLELTLGLRYSNDEKTYCNKTPQSPSVAAFMEMLTGVPEGGLAYTPNGDTFRCATDSWSAWQPRAVVNYYFDEEILTYASITRGYKAGGFTKLGDGLASFDPEYIWNYELGLKSTLWDGRMRLNSALFYYEYSDLQVNGLVPDASGINKAVIQNAGEASGLGIEVDAVIAPSDSVMINAAFAYTEAEYDEFIEVIDTGTGETNDRAGNWLAPRLQAVLGIDWTFPLAGAHEMTLRAEAFHTGRFYYDDEQLDKRPSRTLANARLTYLHPDGALRVTAYVENLTDKEYYDNKEGLFDPPFTTTHRRKPRTYGITASYDF